MRPALLLALLLGGLCRRGHADDTTTVTTVNQPTRLVTTSITQRSGTTTVTTPPPVLPGTTPTPSPTTLSPTATTSSIQPTGTRETTTSKASSTDSPSAPAGSPTGVGAVKPTSSVRTSASDVPTATTIRPVAPPTSGVATTQPPPAMNPTAAGTVGTTSSVSPSSKSVASTSLAQNPTNVITATNPTVTTSQGRTGGTQARTPVSQDSVTTASGQSASSTKGPVAPDSRPTTPSKETLVTPGTKPEGTPRTTVFQSPPAGPQSSPSSPGVLVPVVTTKAPPPQHNLPTGEGNHTWFLTQTQILCESEIPSEKQFIILTLNESTSCERLTKSSVADPLLNMLCKTLKPNFNRSRDQCVVRLAPVADNPKGLAIVGISVQIHAVADELYESLKIKEAELEKFGVKNITYSGQIETLESEDRFSMPLIITIVCMAASLLLVAAIYGCCHQRISQRKDQQRLTEELQTVENGYHDNPTLEVMETSSEMQEKKVNLNGELGDSWIVPMDNLTKEDLEEEEDTHL